MPFWSSQETACLVFKNSIFHENLRSLQIHTLTIEKVIDFLNFVCLENFCFLVLCNIQKVFTRLTSTSVFFCFIIHSLGNNAIFQDKVIIIILIMMMTIHLHIHNTTNVQRTDEKRERAKNF
jgi:hypothetical protein